MLWLWIGFVSLVLVLLALDLFVVNRKPHAISIRQALVFTAIFATIGALFAGVVFYLYEHNVGGVALREAAHAAGSDAAALATPMRGRDAAALYLSGWLVEYALSMDNIFVIALIFAHFRVPAQFQHRVLFWGVIGALLLRGVMIGVGAELVHRFEWVLYFFGVFLIFTAIKMLRSGDGGDEAYDPEKGWIYRVVSRLVKLTPKFHEQKFFVRDAASGALLATPLFLVLLIVEATDVVFAVDSIPAIFSITRDPFLVFTSNVFAILGLRSLYFALAGAMHQFRFLKHSLALVLAFVGGKMLLEGVHQLHTLENFMPSSLHFLTSWLPHEQIHVPAPWSLGTIAGLLVLGIVASLVFKAPPSPGAPADASPPRA